MPQGAKVDTSVDFLPLPNHVKKIIKMAIEDDTHIMLIAIKEDGFGNVKLRGAVRGDGILIGDGIVQSANKGAEDLQHVVVGIIKRLALSD